MQILSIYLFQSQYVKIMVKVVKSQPADHSTKRTGSAVDTTDHVVPSGQFKNSIASLLYRSMVPIPHAGWNVVKIITTREYDPACLKI